MPVFGLCVAALPIVAVLAITALVRTLLLPFSAVRSFQKSRAARA